MFWPRGTTKIFNLIGASQFYDGMEQMFFSCRFAEKMLQFYNEEEKIRNQLSIMKQNPLIFLQHYIGVVELYVVKLEL